MSARIALNRTTLNYVAGARGRLSGLTVAAISALMLIADPGFLAYVPKFVLGGSAALSWRQPRL